MSLLHTAVGIFTISNPIGNLPIYLSFTKDLTTGQQHDANRPFAQHGKKRGRISCLRRGSTSGVLAHLHTIDHRPRHSSSYSLKDRKAAGDKERADVQRPSPQQHPGTAICEILNGQGPLTS